MPINMPPGVETLTVADDLTDSHPVKLDYTDGRKTEAKSVIMNDDGTWNIEDERQR